MYANVSLAPNGDLNGKQALTLIDPPSNTDSTWWVSTTGEPVMLKWTSGKNTKYTFSYDDVNVVTAPPADQTVNINDVNINDHIDRFTEYD